MYGNWMTVMVFYCLRHRKITSLGESLTALKGHRARRSEGLGTTSGSTAGRISDEITPFFDSPDRPLEIECSWFEISSALKEAFPHEIAF
jgi:hypothetical protein